MGKLKELTGQRFGRLIVIRRAENNRQGKPQWLCECDCGKQTIVYGYSLTRGATKSCGCLLKETAARKNTTHGSRYTRLYNSWRGMCSRCNSPKSTAYQDYGGRGIHVCKEWTDFSVFMEWAVSNGYEDGLTIDRIDNSGNYEPSNCRWVDRKGQNWNRRSNHFITYNGETKTVTEWAERFGLKPYTIARRLKRGWNIDKALKTPMFH